MFCVYLNYKSLYLICHEKRFWSFSNNFFDSVLYGIILSKKPKSSIAKGMKQYFVATIVIKTDNTKRLENQNPKKIFTALYLLIFILISVPSLLSFIFPYTSGKRLICPRVHRWSLKESSEITPRKNFLNTLSS